MFELIYHILFLFLHSYYLHQSSTVGKSTKSKLTVAMCQNSLPHDSRLELVDELRMQDIQITGLSVPILVRIDLRKPSSRALVENSVWPTTLRGLVVFTESLCVGSSLNLTSVLYQHNSTPLLSYLSGHETSNIKAGGTKEDEICSRLSNIFSQIAAPNIVKQLSWFYIFDHKLSYIIPGWSQAPLVQYLLYTVSSKPKGSSSIMPYCEPATKWIYCLRGKLIVHILPPTSSNMDVFKNFLDTNDKNEIYKLFQIDSTEARLTRNQIIFIPAGWIFYSERDPYTIEYGGEFFHNFSIEVQLSVWQLYNNSYLRSLESGPPLFYTCHWLVLHSYLSSFQDTMLTTQEVQFNLENHRSLLPHFSPFECRGMLFIIELIRSGRLPIMRQCIPSCVNCPISLLQKMQTILLHRSVFSIFSSSSPNGVMFVGTPKETLTSILASECNVNGVMNKQPSLPFVSFASNALQSSVQPSANQTKETSENTIVPTDAKSTESVYTNSPAKVNNPTLDTPFQCLSVSIPLIKVNMRNGIDDPPSDAPNHIFPSPLGTNTSSLYYSDTIKSLNGQNENSDSQQSYQSCSTNNIHNDDNATDVHLTCTLREFLTTYISKSKLRYCGVCQYCTLSPQNICPSCTVQYDRNCSSCNDRFCILSGIADIDLTPEMLLNAPPIFTKFVQILCAYTPLSLETTLGYILNETIQLSRASFLPIKKSTLKDIQEILLKLQAYEFGRLSVPINQSTPLNTPSK